MSALKRLVTSPGGATAADLAALGDGRRPASVDDAKRIQEGMR